MRVLLAVMPFADVRPALGVSLLKAHLGRIGVDARVEYFSIRLARLLGGADYAYLAGQMPAESLAGDWVFSETLFGSRPAADAAYLEDLRSRSFTSAAAGESATRRLLGARERAERFIDASLSQVDWTQFDVIGFTSSFAQNVAALSLARRVKAANPKAMIVFGGANCEGPMGLGLHRAFPFVDFVCSGEADVSFPALVAALRDGEDGHGIPGVISRRDGESQCVSLSADLVQDLDALPHPDFDDYFAQYAEVYGPILKGQASVLMESSRGCWWGQKHHCTFCGLNGTTMAFRSKSPARVLTEIDDLNDRYAPGHIAMVDNILDMKYYADLLPELARRRLPINLFYETKSNLRRDQVELLRDANVAAIQPGIESLSTDVLRLMRKGTSAVQNVQLLKWCAEVGIEVCWNWLYGFPGETPDAYAEIGDIVASISHLEPPRGFGPIRLDRFSPNYEAAARFGLSDVRPDRTYAQVYDLPDEALRDIAYYFEFDYADGRDPEDYVSAARTHIHRWCADHRPGRLVYADHGDSLAIWDFRAAAVQRLTVLGGWARRLYLYCDQHRSDAHLAHFAEEMGAACELEPTLADLLAKRLMLRIDGCCLSLAVPMKAASAPAVAAAPERRPEPVCF